MAPKEAAPPRLCRLRDLAMDPERGVQGDVSWQQFEGSLQLRLPLSDASLSPADLEASLGGALLAVRCRGEPLPSLCGWLPGEAAPRESWFDLEECGGGSRALLLSLAKKRPREQWGRGRVVAFCEEDEVPHETVMLAVRAGRPADEEEAYRASRGQLCAGLELGQTEETVHVHVPLQPEKLAELVKGEKQDACGLFGADVGERTLRLFLRGDAAAPVLLGELGGSVLPEQSSMRLAERGARGTPCLELELVKAAHCRRQWREVLAQQREEAEVSGSLEELERRLLRQQRPPSPDRRGWGDLDYAQEEKKRADAAFKEGSYRDALVHYSHALKRAPGDFKVLSNRAAAYLKLEKFRLALADAERSGQLGPEWAKARWRRGQALRGLRRWPEALEAFEEGKGLEPGNPEWEKEMRRTRQAWEAA